MKNIPVIGKFLFILAAFGLFAVASTIYATSQMRAIQAGYEAVADGAANAATLLVVANRAFAMERGDVANLMIATSQADHDAALAELKADRAKFDATSLQAAAAAPEDAADIRNLQTRGDALIDNSCSAALAQGAQSTTGPQLLSSQAVYLKDCAPGFPPIVKASIDERVTVQAQAKQERAALAARTDTTILTTFAIVLSGLVLVMLGGFLAIRAWVVQPVRALRETMARLAGGDLEAAVLGSERGDEIGAMARTVKVFKDAAIEKQRIERKVEADRELTAAERAKTEAEREEALRQLQTVIENMSEGLDRLAKGDLIFRLIEWFPVDFKGLRMDFNQAMETLRGTVQAVAVNTAGISASAREITQASDDLARRTEHQAASLEQTAAALEQITATVGKTTEGAKAARQLVEQAKSDAERSANVVGETIAAMSGIEASSAQIGNIIGVIDEIAFQTNLLALNAGVEAARAGDAGRGFAVVATEVRALAQRSADAAKEIKALISASGAQVETGVKLVGETGNALRRTLAQVEEINRLIADIAASAQEQSTGLQEVTGAMNQMDQVTQQNAAMVEQSTAACHSMAAEAAELARLVGQFQTGEQALARAPAVRKPAPKPAAPRQAAPRPAARAPEPLARPVKPPPAAPALSAAGEDWDEF